MRTESLARTLLRELARTHGFGEAPDAPRLIGRRGAAAGTRHVLAGSSVLLGRDAACDIVLLDAEVSREHVRIERRGERVTITDLGAKNRTLVNGVAISPHQPHVLQHDALIEIGGSALAFDDPAQRYLGTSHPDPLFRAPAAPRARTRARLVSLLPCVAAASIATCAILGLFTLWLG